MLGKRAIFDQPLISRTARMSTPYWSLLMAKLMKPQRPCRVTSDIGRCPIGSNRWGGLSWFGSVHALRPMHERRSRRWLCPQTGAHPSTIRFAAAFLIGVCLREARIEPGILASIARIIIVGVLTTSAITLVSFVAHGYVDKVVVPPDYPGQDQYTLVPATLDTRASAASQLPFPNEPARHSGRGWQRLPPSRDRSRCVLQVQPFETDE